MLMLLRLITGPSTNFYVGPREKHYMIQKRLLYHFSEYAKMCLEGGFLEAGTNAIYLQDVDPDVFQYIWQWLYTGEMRLDSFYDSVWSRGDGRGLVQAYQLLCRLHVLGERLLFDERFLKSAVQTELNKVIEKAEINELPIPFNPDIVEEVLSESAPAQYENWGFSSTDDWDWFFSFSLRPIVLRHWCNFKFCTKVDFKEYKNCFRRDGAFAAELLTFLIGEIKWAKERGEAEVGRPIDAFDIKEEQPTEGQTEPLDAFDMKKEEPTEGQPGSHCATTVTRQYTGIWVALRHVCFSEGCSETAIRAFSKHFELDSLFAAEFLNFAATEWEETVKVWGDKRGEKVDVAAERKKEERLAQEKSDLERSVFNMQQRWGWT